MKTLKKYILFLLLGPVSNFLWAGWVLPEINEQGTFVETVQWISVQALLPLIFCVLLALKQKFVHWMMIVYSGFIILFAVGVLGWALMGPGTPASVYVVCLILFVMGFGILYQSMKDLDFEKKPRRYDAEGE